MDFFINLHNNSCLARLPGINYENNKPEYFQPEKRELSWVGPNVFLAFGGPKVFLAIITQKCRNFHIVTPDWFTQLFNIS